MRERCEYHRFGFKYIAVQALFSILGITSLFVAIRAVESWIQRQNASGSPPLLFMAGLLGFLACLVVTIVVSVLWPRRFRCPKCGLRIPKPQYVARSEGQSDLVLYVCDNCGVEWDTGLRGGGGGGGVGDDGF